MSDKDHYAPGMTHPGTGDSGAGWAANDATGIFPVLGPGLSLGASAPIRPNEEGLAKGTPAGRSSTHGPRSGGRPAIDGRASGGGRIDPPFTWASDPSEATGRGASGPSPRRMGPERWVIAGGTVVALVAGFIAFTSGTPSHAMPSPFSAQPAQSAPAQSLPRQSTPAQGNPSHATVVTPTTCTSVTPAP
jgi:hypothetical protein